MLWDRVTSVGGNEEGCWGGVWGGVPKDTGRQESLKGQVRRQYSRRKPTHESICVTNRIHVDRYLLSVGFKDETILVTFFIFSAL